MSTKNLPLQSLTLDEIADEIQMGSTDATVYLNPKTGQMTRISQMAMALDEQEEAIGKAGGEENLLALPHVESHGGYRWMEEFAETVTGERLLGMLNVALNGRGAFRRFKDVLAAFPVERQRWFEFERLKLLKMAREWAEMNGIKTASSST